MKNINPSFTTQKITHYILLLSIIAMAFAAIISISGCSDSTTEPNSSGQINMTSQYSSSDSPSPMQFPKIYGSGISAVDSLIITRARFVIRDIKFKTQSDSSNFRATPFVLELDLSKVSQQMSVANVPFGTYRKIEFDVHRINSTEVNTLPTADQVPFQDFLVGDTFSIIITGTLYNAGQSASFTFRSRLNVKQKIDLSPEIVISEPSPAVNATMLISSGGWFKSSTGALLDPTDALNENTITDNLRASIKVFKDNNKDGSKDSN